MLIKRTISSNRSSLHDDVPIYPRPLFQIFTQPIDAIDVTRVTDDDHDDYDDHDDHDYNVDP